MASTNDQTQLVGTFKDVWGSNVIDGFKFAAPLLNAVPFKESQLIGGKYHVAVDLALEHGFTAAAAANTPTLLAAVAGKLADAQVTGSQLYGRSLVSYEAIMRSASDKQAVREATKHVVRRLGLSGTKRLEIQFIHGQKGLGIASTGSGSTTAHTITMTDETWSAGIWAGAEGATLDLYDTTLATKQNTNAPLVVTAVDMVNKKVSFSNNTSDATAIESAYAASGVLFWETHAATTEFAGVDAISRNTGSFQNIDASTYALWAGNVYSTSTGTIAMSKILDALAAPASFGLMGLKSMAVVAPKAFEVMNTDLAALRAFNVNYRPASAENGFEGLTFHGQTGPVEVLAHPFQKDGYVHIFVPEEMQRIGASDLSFIDRGGPTPRLILEAANSPASEMRVQSHQALFCELPRHTVVMGGITY